MLIRKFLIFSVLIISTTTLGMNSLIGLPEEIKLEVFGHLTLWGCRNLPKCSKYLNEFFHNDHVRTTLINKFSPFNFPFSKETTLRYNLLIISSYELNNNLFVNTPIGNSCEIDGERTISIQSRRNHSIALTADGIVFSWGSNNIGHLGLGHIGHRRNIDTPTQVLGPLEEKKIIYAQIGSHFCVALTVDGELFTWGINYSGQLGFGHKEDFIDTPTQVKGLLEGKRVAFVQVGDFHVIAITTDGEIFSWGSNQHGQLGLGHINNVETPTQVVGLPKGKRIVSIQAGSYHSTALTAEGEVFNWGGNWGSVANVALPSQIPCD